MVEEKIIEIIGKYQEAFSGKEIVDESAESDILMEIFGITHEMKKTNMQYWGRELGKCWEKIIQSVFSEQKGYGGGIREGGDEICDCVYGKKAIEAKYRVGSGDSGTLKKFKQYAQRIKDAGYEPIMLFLREDNLPAAMTACKHGGWTVLIGKDCFDFIKKETKFELDVFLKSLKGKSLLKKKTQTKLS